LEEEGDPVLEAGHGLEREREGDGLPAGRRRAQVLEAHGLLADPLEEAGRIDLVRRDGEDALGEEVGVLAAELFDVGVPLAVDGLGIVEDEDGIAEVIRQRDEVAGEEERLGGEARAKSPRPRAAILASRSRATPLDRFRRRPSTGPGSRGGREFPEPRDGQAIDPLEGALAGDVELAE